MRFAYNTNGCAHHRLDDALDLIAAAGFDGVAFTVDWPHVDVLAPDADAHVRRLRDGLRARALGLVVETGARYVLSPVKHAPNLLDADPAARARRLDFLVRCLDLCAACEGETVSFWSGIAPPGDAAGAWGRLEDGVGALAEAAHARGVALSFEPEPGMLAETLADYDRLRAVAPALRLALDAGHLVVTGEADPADAVRAYAGHLGTVSVEGMRRGAHVHLPLGEGDLDVPAVLAALADVGFGGLVCAEHSRESPRAHEAIPESAAYLRAHAPAERRRSRPPRPHP